MKLTKQELETLQRLNADFAKLKMQVGDIELQKQMLLSEIQSVRTEFAIHEKELIKKYGENAVINLQTGAINQKDGKD